MVERDPNMAMVLGLMAETIDAQYLPDAGDCGHALAEEVLKLIVFAHEEGLDLHRNGRGGKIMIRHGLDNMELVRYGYRNHDIRVDAKCLRGTKSVIIITRNIGSGKRTASEFKSRRGALERL